jgi:hypothetical protein
MFKSYRKKGTQLMRPYVNGENMLGISVSAPDMKLKNLDGGMIAVSAENPDDKWYVSKEFFDKNYIPA